MLYTFISDGKRRDLIWDDEQITSVVGYRDAEKTKNHTDTFLIYI